MAQLMSLAIMEAWKRFLLFILPPCCLRFIICRTVIASRETSISAAPSGFAGGYSGEQQASSGTLPFSEDFLVEVRMSTSLNPFDKLERDSKESGLACCSEEDLGSIVTSEMKYVAGEWSAYR